MQRRLTLTLVSLTLFAVFLVGTGVLAFAQIGAGQETEELVESQLEALSEISTTTNKVDILGGRLRRFGQAFDAGELQIVVVTNAGDVHAIDKIGRENASAGNFQFTLTPEEIEQLRSGESLLVRHRRSVVGLQALDVQDERASLRNAQVAVLLRQGLSPLPGKALQWFLLSAALVVAASVIAASWLARRFTNPIRAIQDATTKLADGDLATRVKVTGTDEVADLANSVNKMATDLERSRQLEQQFLLSVSHDLRTPLTSISGYAEALVDDAIEDPVAAGVIIQTHAGRLDRLVTDLLDLAKLDARQFRIQPTTIDTTASVRNTVEGLEPVAQRHDLTLSIRGDEGLMISADADRLSQVVANLVENAIKYAASAIDVDIRTESSSDRSDPARISITVRDDGPGIPTHDLPHIFERLYVTQRRPLREESSSGLGLAIVRELVSAMNGTVHAQASEMSGTAMVVRFNHVEP